MWLFDIISSLAVVGRKKSMIKQQLFDYESKKQMAEQESILEAIKASFRDKADLNKRIELLTSQLDEREIANKDLVLRLKIAEKDLSRLQFYIRQLNDYSISDDEKKEFNADLTDEIMSGCLITHDGAIVHPQFADKS